MFKNTNVGKNLNTFNKKKKEKANPSLFLNLGLFLLNAFYIIYWYLY